MAIPHDIQHPQPINLESLLPALDAQFDSARGEAKEALRGEVTDYIEIAKFAASLGLPFCIEYNPSYRAPHAVLHEIGHWAVKPDAYIEVYRALSRRDFPVERADVTIAKRYGKPETIKNVLFYAGANDRMPDWDLIDGMDPTPNEKSVRSWTRHAIDQLGIKDPVVDGRTRTYSSRGTGDAVVSKGSSLRTWSQSAAHNPRAVQEFKLFGIDPAHGNFRPLEDSLDIPFPKPSTMGQLTENAAAMAAQYPDATYTYEGQQEEWVEHIKWKYDGVLLNDL